MSANKSLASLMVPAALAASLMASLGACTQTGGATQPGCVNTSANNRYNSGYSSPQGGEQGRVVSVREVPLRGGSGMNGGTLVGGLLGAVGGAIAGNIVGSNGSSQRGIEVTVQKDDGQTVTIAQADNGDMQMGDRVRIVQDRNGVPVAVRDQGVRRDL